LYKDQYTFLIISRSILLRMRNFSDKVVEKIKAHILCSITVLSENLAVNEIMWKKYGRVRQTTDGNKTRCIRCACWINKATDRHSEYVILIALRRKQWFRERPLVLLSYVHFLSFSSYLLVTNAECNRIT